MREFSKNSRVVLRGGDLDSVTDVGCGCVFVHYALSHFWTYLGARDVVRGFFLINEAIVGFGFVSVYNIFTYFGSTLGARVVIRGSVLNGGKDVGFGFVSVTHVHGGLGSTLGARVVFRGAYLDVGTHVGFGCVDVYTVLAASWTLFGARVITNISDNICDGIMNKSKNRFPLTNKRKACSNTKKTNLCLSGRKQAFNKYSTVIWKTNWWTRHSLPPLSIHLAY